MSSSVSEFTLMSRLFNFVSVARLAAVGPSSGVLWRYSAVRADLLASCRTADDDRGVPVRFKITSFGAAAISATVALEIAAFVVLKFPSISSRPTSASVSSVIFAPAGRRSMCVIRNGSFGRSSIRRTKRPASNVTTAINDAEG